MLDIQDIPVLPVHIVRIGEVGQGGQFHLRLQWRDGREGGFVQ